MVLLWLHINSYSINASIGCGEPVFTAHHLKESKHGNEYVVKISLEVDPVATPVVAVKFIFHSFNIYRGTCPQLLAIVIFASEETNAYQPINENKC
jgi:hypothetical protein